MLTSEIQTPKVVSSKRPRDVDSAAQLPVRGQKQAKLIGAQKIVHRDDSGSGATRDKSAVIKQGRVLHRLLNLGNTCFMNSSLQCLSSSEALTGFFLTDSWQKDLNGDNPLGMQGNLAEEFSKVVTDLRGEPRNFAVSTGDFKRVIDLFAPQFTGNSQHDSQEFLAFLLDGLHQDLIRIHSKPVIEIPTGNGTNTRWIA